MGLVTITLPWTVAVYLGFALFYGASAFEAIDPPGCGNIIDCLVSIVDILVGVVNFIFLGLPLGSDLNIWVAGILFVFAWLPWFFVFIGIGRGTPVD